MSFWQAVGRFMGRGALLLTLVVTLTASAVPLRSTDAKVRQFTRTTEFDFAQWTIHALAIKLGAFGLGASSYLAGPEQAQQVRDYFKLVDRIDADQSRLADIYSDPNIPDPKPSAAPVQAELTRLNEQRRRAEPLVEAILQEQVAVTLDQIGLGETGAPFPPVAFHFSTLPNALIISPRDSIRQDANIELVPDISLPDQVALEQGVESALGVSALVVPVGGIGTYPTMVLDSTDLSWILEVIAHEWTHNYLDIRPLGMNYDTSPQLRTMNETTATLVGQEASRRARALFYPELLPPPAPPPPPAQAAPPPPPPPTFDFQKEMRTTRVQVDELLGEGKIDEAEAYMEARRQVFWDHGYHIRRINQAYFAFYGAYAGQPGGAAGDDPVGAAVRALWFRADSPAAFLRTMAWLTSFEQLQQIVSSPLASR